MQYSKYIKYSFNNSHERDNLNCDRLRQKGKKDKKTEKKYYKNRKQKSMNITYNKCN